MRSNFVLVVACRYFSAKKNEKFVSLISGFSLLGVTIGVAALIVVTSVMNGFHLELTKNIIGLNGDITITNVDRYITNYDKARQLLNNNNYIKAVVPNIVGQALAIGPRTNSGVLIKGIDINDLQWKKAVLQNVVAGQFGDFSSNNIIAMGSELAYLIGAKIGNKIKLISPNTISTAFGSMPRAKEFTVTAIFNSGMYDYDVATVLMPISAARNFLSFEDNTINLIEVYTKQPEQAELFANEIQAILGEKFKVTSWQKSNRQFLNALAVERITMFTILSLIIVVAAFNIISSLVMLVKDKTKDIAILRTIGASQQQIMLIFICNGMFIGLIGTVVGGILGASFAYNIDNIRLCLERLTDTKIFDAAIYFLYSLPSDVRLEDIILVSVLSIFLCFCATIYPAYKASKLNPVEALRYE
ncbi:Putative lipoprotein ABC transporter permease [Candidatus Trichorickettsia mobilis]|uniref:Lipoprotein ABC transporter permease n=1 Tax=Candidatus Trichorickettsia mobilis TaxID=1346319 RepID=A0ABZ0UV21_9RICK|nr:lipoprotein-releasing ABC transporter permease subunit [Candidatus Trichorickettsia mobilis]WPY00472.1 Putative lipoprotein ABC transporter permease [Candidatus Trichorickettsia mobilis]